MRYLLPFKSVIAEMTRPASIQDASDKLRRSGWIEIGSGAFATVLSNPAKPYVLKLFKSSDKAYRRFLDAIRNNPKNPHFPKLRGIPIKVTKDYYAIRMEKLTKFNYDNEYHHDDMNDIHQYIDAVDGLEQALARKHDPDRWIRQIGRDPAKYKKRMEPLLTTRPDLADAIDIIDRKVKRPTGAKFDLHNGNIMYRGKIPVITDPVAWGHSATSALPHFPQPKQKEFDFNPPKIQPKKRVDSPLSHAIKAGVFGTTAAGKFANDKLAQELKPKTASWRKRAKELQVNNIVDKVKKLRGKNKIVYDMLTRAEGCTTQEVLRATNWKQVSVAGMAHMMGLTIRKRKEWAIVQGRHKRVTRYFATPKKNI